MDSVLLLALALAESSATGHHSPRPLRPSHTSPPCLLSHLQRAPPPQSKPRPLQVDGSGARRRVAGPCPSVPPFLICGLRRIHEPRLASTTAAGELTPATSTSDFSAVAGEISSAACSSELFPKEGSTDYLPFHSARCKVAQIQSSCRFPRKYHKIKMLRCKVQVAHKEGSNKQQLDGLMQLASVDLVIVS